MSISNIELYHGAVLTQIIRNPDISIKLFERNSEEGWGAYYVFDNLKQYLIYIKYTTNVSIGKKKKRSTFTFSPEDIVRIKRHLGEREIMVCLVCGAEEICLLDERDLDELELLDNHSSFVAVSVSWEKGTSLSVKSRGRELSHKVPRNRLKNFAWK